MKPAHFGQALLGETLRLASGRWNYLACGTGVRSSRARHGVQYGSAWTRIVLTLKSGWFCGEFPSARARSQVVVWYRR